MKGLRSIVLGLNYEFQVTGAVNAVSEGLKYTAMQ